MAHLSRRPADPPGSAGVTARLIFSRMLKEASVLERARLADQLSMVACEILKREHLRAVLKALQADLSDAIDHLGNAYNIQESIKAQEPPAEVVGTIEDTVT